MHLFPHELASLRAGRLSFALVLLDALECFLFRHGYFTSKSFWPAVVPLRVTTTWYLPAGRPSGLEIWNSVRTGASPLGEIVREVSFTTLLSCVVQRVPSAAGPAPFVSTDPYITSTGRHVPALSSIA